MSDETETGGLFGFTTTRRALSTATPRKSDRLDKARERLDEALEAIRALCEPVEAPREATPFGSVCRPDG